MHFGVVGLNHKTAPIEIREQVAVTREQLPSRLKSLLATQWVEEGVLLSTCNRTEIYFTSLRSFPEIRSYLYAFLQNGALFSDRALDGYCYEYQEEKAVEHLLRVTCGLDSMMLGESQILAQVRTAYEVARAEQTADVFLNALFHRVLHAGGRARHETRIGEHPVSVSHAAVQLAKKIFGKDFKLHSVLILGAGKISELTAKLFQKFGPQSIYVANRSFERAQTLAHLLKGKAIPFSLLSTYLTQVDVVISSTSSSRPLITYEGVKAAMVPRRDRSLFFIDIAVPRDVDPRVGTMDNVFLYDIDDLKAVVYDNFKCREKEVPKVERVIHEEAQRFWKWDLSRRAVQLVRTLKKGEEAAWQEGWQQMLRAELCLDEKERQAFEDFRCRLMNRTLSVASL